MHLECRWTVGIDLERELDDVRTDYSRGAFSTATRSRSDSPPATRPFGSRFQTAVWKCKHDPEKTMSNSCNHSHMSNSTSPARTTHSLSAAKSPASPPVHFSLSQPLTSCKVKMASHADLTNCGRRHNTASQPAREPSHCTNRSQLLSATDRLAVLTPSTALLLLLFSRPAFFNPQL